MHRLALALCAITAWAAEPVVAPLWQKTMPDREVVEKGKDGQRRVRNVTRPSMQVFLPAAGTATGGAVIVCPGGGYVMLAIDKEGDDVARWLNGLGVAAFVLRYRVIPSEAGVAMPAAERLRKRETYVPLALEDGERAVRLVRYNARKWNIDPRRIALMGFSAGGHLAANVAMHCDAGAPAARDPVERVSSRPDALIPIYPGKFDDPVFPAGTPPAFIVHANDDGTVPAENSAQLYLALKKVKAPAELHIYAKGGHGFGMVKAGRAVDQWPERLRDWLDAQGWLRRQP